MNPKTTYVGFHRDRHGITQIGRIVLDAWLFGLIPREEDCAGWTLQRLQQLMERVHQEWDKYGNLPSLLPPELKARHAELYDWATRRARELGWDPAPEEEE